MSPKPPYYAVIFTSRRTASAETIYATTATQILDLAVQQEGYLAIESAHDSVGQGITISYWDSLENINKWKSLADHVVAQRLGRSTFYEEYRVRIARVEREYGWKKADSAGGGMSGGSDEDVGEGEINGAAEVPQV